MLAEELWQEISAKVGEELELEDYMIGAKYSYAIVSGERGKAIGTSYLPLEDISRGFSRKPRFSEVGSMLSSTNIFEKSLGVAILNAVSQYLLWHCGKYVNFDISYGNMVNELAALCRGNAKIVMVGNMGPVASRLRERSYDVTVLERNPRFRRDALADIFAPRVIPQADALIVTGTTLINDTLGYVLSLARRAKLIALVGPTASIYPTQQLRGITHIAALKIENIDKVAEIIRLGGGRWDFGKYAKEYIIHIAKSK